MGVQSAITGGVLVHSSGFPEPRAMGTCYGNGVQYCLQPQGDLRWSSRYEQEEHTDTHRRRRIWKLKDSNSLLECVWE